MLRRVGEKAFQSSRKDSGRLFRDRVDQVAAEVHQSGPLGCDDGCLGGSRIVVASQPAQGPVIQALNPQADAVDPQR